MDLSVVIPLYNEEESLRPLNKILKNVLGKLNVKYEILYIDDGSRDESVKILKEIAER